MTQGRTTSDRKRLAILGAVGLGLAMAARRHRGHHYAFSQMHHGGTLPPMIDAKLRAWHEQAHGKTATSDARQQPGNPTQV